MPNRQHGRRSPSASRPARSVPVSRSPSGSRTGGEIRTASRPQSGVPDYIEPEVRRWPHPVGQEELPSSSAPEPALHYIRCALSYQNQLLADIKVLLEQLAADRGAESPAAGASLDASPEKG